MTEILIPSIDCIGQAAKEFVAQIGQQRIFAFYGGMGAGKTTLIKKLIEEAYKGEKLVLIENNISTFLAKVLLQCLK